MQEQGDISVWVSTKRYNRIFKKIKEQKNMIKTWQKTLFCVMAFITSVTLIFGVACIVRLRHLYPPDKCKLVHIDTKNWTMEQHIAHFKNMMQIQEWEEILNAE